MSDSQTACRLTTKLGMVISQGHVMNTCEAKCVWLMVVGLGLTQAAVKAIAAVNFVNSGATTESVRMGAL